MKQCKAMPYKYYLSPDKQTRLEILGIPLVKVYEIPLANDQGTGYGFYQPHLDTFIFADTEELKDVKSHNRWWLLLEKFNKTLTQMQQPVNECE